MNWAQTGTLASAPLALAPTNDVKAAAERMMRLLEGFDGAYGTHGSTSENEKKGGKLEIRETARTIREPVTPGLWMQHLQGEHPLGIITIREDDTCLWGAIDVDEYPVDLGEIARKVEKNRLPLIVCRTKSGGAHLYMFLAEPVLARDLRQRLKRIAAAMGYPTAEIFPKQDTVLLERGDLGNWLNMPYLGGDGTQRYAVKTSGLAMTLAEFLHTAESSRVSLADLADAIGKICDPTIAAKVLPTTTQIAGELARLEAEVRHAASRDANNTLNRAAFTVGTYLTTNLLDEDQARSRIMAAWTQRAPGREHEFYEVWRRATAKGRAKGLTSDGRAPDQPVVVRLSDVEPRPVEWLWPGRFALGKLSIIAGPPGVGKSQICAWIAARVTTGGDWPFGEGHALPGDVIMLSAEDDAADTIRPRLDAAGADPSRVMSVEAIRSGAGSRGLDLSRDVEMLGDVIELARDPQLVIIDPISAYLGRTDSHRNSDVRGVLAPVQELAERHRVAVICVSHLTKARQSAINSVTGSGAFVAAARTACLVTKETEPDDDGGQVETGRRLMTVAKNNLGPDGAEQGLAYEIAEVEIGSVRAPVVRWIERVSVTADDALGSGDRERVARPRERAIAFLRRLLLDGAVPAAELEQLAQDEGVSAGTLKNARRDLGIVATREKRGGRDVWMCSLPGRQEELPV